MEDVSEYEEIITLFDLRFDWYSTTIEYLSKCIDLIRDSFDLKLVAIGIFNCLKNLACLSVVALACDSDFRAGKSEEER